jgi:hypothetical protein
MEDNRGGRLLVRCFGSHLAVQSLLALAIASSPAAARAGVSIVCGPEGDFLTCIDDWNKRLGPPQTSFSFESGLQGWTLEGSAQRVNTQVLGGEWAIFGDGRTEGGASMSITLDLTGIDSIVMDVFFGGEPDFLIPTLAVNPGPLGGGSKIPFFIWPTREGDGNAARLIFDLPSLAAAELVFAWPGDLEKCFREPCLPAEPDSRLAFVDNITFVPIPEPSTLLAERLRR